MATAKQQNEAIHPKKAPVAPPAAGPGGALEREAKAKEVSALARETVAKQKRKAAEITPASQEPAETEQQLQRLTAANTENMNAVLKANEALFEGFASIGQEMMNFANDRLRQDFEVVESLMHATGPEEIYRRQSQFAETASQQYLEEANKLIDLMTRTARDCWAPLQARQDQAKRDADGD